MSTDHHDFVFQFWIGPGNLRDRVEAVLVVARELGLDIHLDGDRNVAFKSRYTRP